MNRNSFENWLEVLKAQNDIVLFSHVNPDGDTTGATLGLRLALLALGKRVRLICDGTVPETMRFLEGSGEYHRPEEAEDWEIPAALAVDAASADMLGAARPLFERAAIRLVIDHHPTNPAYGQENFLRPGEAATCLLAYEAIRALGVTITLEMGTCLMLGMSTDTGHFQYSYTSPAILRAAADLVELGVSLSDISRRMYRSQPMRKLRLTRIALENLRYFYDDQMALIVLNKAAYDETGCSFGEADGIVNQGLEVEGVRFAFMLSERPDGIKVSMRSVEPDTVNDIAFALGGGGHAQAAGCTLHMSLEEAERVLLWRVGQKVKGA